MAILGAHVLGKATLRTIQVHVPEWDGDVLLRKLSEDEYNQAQAYAMKALSMKKDNVEIKDVRQMAMFRVTVVAFAWVTEAGEQVLELNEATRLLKEPHTVIERLFDAASEFNGVKADDPVADAEKNSEATQ